MYETISAFALGLGLGIIGTSIWLGSKIRELKNKILDKQTIAKLLKETLIENKPKAKYKKPYKKKYGSNGRKKSTRGSKVAGK
tara:strand:- start:102 stop:350 length:249 start_codon:yes stop_codon:yes gene_type:complete